MKRRFCLPNDPKIVVCICFGAFWICNKVLSYGRLTIIFEIVLFKYTRWAVLLRYTFLPDALGDMLFYLSASLCVVRPTYRASHRVVGTQSFLADGSITLVL